MNLNILALIFFSYFKKESIDHIQFNRKITNLTLPTKISSILTPRYFTVSEGYSLLPHSLIFKSPSNFLCLNFEITISVFLALTQILFVSSQITRCFRSAFTSLFSFVIELLRHNKLMSSSKW